MTLEVLRFDEFFHALHKCCAFPWQRALVKRVYEDGRWPPLLDLPTGSGKTATIDVAVFLLALGCEHPRRIVFVVDRRIIVHQAAVRARTIAERLAEARGGILLEVAQRLRGLAGEGLPAETSPLQRHELRGGTVRDDTWVRRPDVPAVIVSTVDQVGSRLLFRGYGVSSGMRPVQAGLLANDTLFLLDEVHLAKSFADTLAAVARHYRPPAEAGIPNRWQITRLSATPVEDDLDEEPFSLTDDDREPDCLLAQRLTASKPARTGLVKVTGRDEQAHRRTLARACAHNARTLLDQGARTVGVVVNRVDTASKIHELLHDDGVAVKLLTGRMRPLDRDQVLEDIDEQVRIGRARDVSDPPLVLVCTQAIEAGADFDLDALVTECASLDALIQRFGRVDRNGDVSKEGRQHTSVILATSAAAKKDADDPIYGKRLAATWSWLREQPRLDFGSDHFAIDPEIKADLVAQPLRAPHLLPSHLDRWVQTSHRPDADPDPAHWLHGIRSADTDVTVVWRADLTQEALEAGQFEQLKPLLRLCAPSIGEAMPLPISAVRSWLADKITEGEEFPALSDVESVPLDEPERPQVKIAPVVAWAGDDSEVLTRRTEVRPGMMLVVPAAYGGISADCWDPRESKAVRDLGTEANWAQRRRLVLRLNAGSIAELDPPQPPKNLDEDTDEKRRAAAWVKDNQERILKQLQSGPEVPSEQLEQQLGQKMDVRIVARRPADDGSDAERMFILQPRGARTAAGRAVDSEPATSPFLGASVGLHEHLEDARRWARAFAESCGVSEALAGDLALAAALHDLGKADPRCQRMLAAEEIGAAGQLLAKSVTRADDYATRLRRARVAGYDRGTRHELTSVALVQHDEQLVHNAHDWDLVLHLIASHHGYGRPFFNANAASGHEKIAVTVNGRTLTCTSDHRLVRLDSGVTQRFWRCVRRYGWFGLAWLEAILRLADHRASEYAVEGRHDE